MRASVKRTMFLALMAVLSVRCVGDSRELCKLAPEGCPAGVQSCAAVSEHKSIFVNSAQAFNIHEARHWCFLHGGELASLHSWKDNEKVMRLLGGKDAWIGALKVGDEWTWEDGSKWDATSWAHTDGLQSDGRDTSPETRICIHDGVWHDWNDGMLAKKGAVCQSVLSSPVTRGCPDHLQQFHTLNMYNTCYFTSDFADASWCVAQGGQVASTAEKVMLLPKLPRGHPHSGKSNGDDIQGSVGSIGDDFQGDVVGSESCDFQCMRFEAGMIAGGCDIVIQYVYCEMTKCARDECRCKNHNEPRLYCEDAAHTVRALNKAARIDCQNEMFICQDATTHSVSRYPDLHNDPIENVLKNKNSTASRQWENLLGVLSDEDQREVLQQMMMSRHEFKSQSACTRDWTKSLSGITPGCKFDSTTGKIKCHWGDKCRGQERMAVPFTLSIRSLHFPCNEDCVTHGTPGRPMTWSYADVYAVHQCCQVCMETAQQGLTTDQVDTVTCGGCSRDAQEDRLKQLSHKPPEYCQVDAESGSVSCESLGECTVGSSSRPFDAASFETTVVPCNCCENDAMKDSCCRECLEQACSDELQSTKVVCLGCQQESSGTRFVMTLDNMTTTGQFCTLHESMNEPPAVIIGGEIPGTIGLAFANNVHVQENGLSWRRLQASNFDVACAMKESIVNVCPRCNLWSHAVEIYERDATQADERGRRLTQFRELAFRVKSLPWYKRLLHRPWTLFQGVAVDESVAQLLKHHSAQELDQALDAVFSENFGGSHSGATEVLFFQVGVPWAAIEQLQNPGTEVCVAPSWWWLWLLLLAAVVGLYTLKMKMEAKGTLVTDCLEAGNANTPSLPGYSERIPTEDPSSARGARGPMQVGTGRG